MTEVILEQIWIEGAGGSLSGEFAYPNSDVLASVLLLNPHPLMGGRMTNKLIEQIAIQLPRHSMASLRFDYRGVGLSDGEQVDMTTSMQQFWNSSITPEEPFILHDAQTALDWLQSKSTGPFVVIGYSFGSYIATQMKLNEVNSIVLISPTIDKHDYSSFSNTQVKTCILCGDDDLASADGATSAWVGQLDGETTFIQLQNVDHFFRGYESDVAAKCVKFILDSLQFSEAGTQ